MGDVLMSLVESGTATLADVIGTRCWVDPSIRPIWEGARLAGRALPVATGPRDNLAIHRALAEADRDDVLVVDAGGELAGYWGEIMTVAALDRGVRGLVIDGGVRDTEEIARLRFPTFARGSCAGGTSKTIAGTVGEPVDVGDLRIRRGDFVVADRDGVVAFAAVDLERVLSTARSRQEKERDMIARLKNGATTVEILSLSITIEALAAPGQPPADNEGGD